MTYYVIFHMPFSETLAFTDLSVHINKTKWMLHFEKQLSSNFR
jgi:hypothetical protein